MSQPKTDVLDDLVATIACVYMGFAPNGYWKRAVIEQYPEALETAKQKIKQLYVLKSDVEKAREAEFKLGYEAGESSANGTMKVLSWKEAKQKLNPKTEEN